MNSDFFILKNNLEASNEALECAYPPCKEFVKDAVKVGGVIVIGASLTFVPIPKPIFADEVKPKPYETSHSDERKNANTFWVVMGTSGATGDAQPMILDQYMSRVEKSLHGINGLAEPLDVYEGQLKKGTPLEIRST